MKMKISASAILILLMLLSPRTTNAQLRFEINASKERAPLENPPDSIMSRISFVDSMPDSLRTKNYKSDVRLSDVIKIIYEKGNKNAAYGSLVKMSGKAYLSIYGELVVTTSGSVQTSDQRIERVGLPPSRIEISGLKKTLYYAGKIWKPKPGKSFIICTSDEIIGVNAIATESNIIGKYYQR